MNTEEISIVAMNPFIQKFILAVITSIKIKNLPHENKHIIHADLVPKTSEAVMMASLKNNEIHNIKPQIKEKYSKRNLNFLVAPIQRRPSNMVAQPRPNRVMPQQNYIQQITPPTSYRETQSQSTQDYGKIAPLLNDPSISTIECKGAGILITVIRAGQRQETKISLGKQEIKDILNKISEKTHIPLLEGVFRAAIDNFSINAVISEMIGSRFVIKKHTAYSLLENS